VATVGDRHVSGLIQQPRDAVPNNGSGASGVSQGSRKRHQM
jgi:hypothetical protein